MRGKIFYGWYVVLAGMGVMASAIGIINNCFGLFIIPVCQDLGLSRQQMAGNQTIITIGATVIALFSFRIFTRYRLKRLMRLGAILVSVSYVFYALSTRLLHFYCVSALLSVGQALLTWVPFSIILSNWFHEKRGFAIGLTFMGSGLGGMVFNALAGSWLEWLGWRTTFALLGGAMALLVLPGIFFVVKIHPYDLNLQPLGEDALAARPVREEVPAGLTLREALHSSKFFALCGCTLLAGIALNAAPSTILPQLVDVGYSSSAAALVTAAMMGALAGGKLTLGILFDKCGARRATAAAALAILLSLLGLLYARFQPALILVVLGAGLGCAFGSVAYPIVAYNLYGGRDLGAINGMLNAVSGAGSAITPIFCGAVFDRVGSYAPSYWAILPLMIVAMGLYVWMMPNAPKYR